MRVSEITIGGRAVEGMSDAELVAWMNETNEGYRLRRETAALWVGVMRVLDMQGPPMTVRGLFYGLEMLGLVQKSEAGYRRADAQILQMRRRGVLPFWAITDGTRFVRKPNTFGNLGAFFNRAAEAYRRALWDTQEAHVEVWCEKDAVSGVLYSVTEPWDVPLYVCRGFPSETLVFNAAEALKATGKENYLYYFGDLDPSGCDISENLARKLGDFGAPFDFMRVAVHPWQVDAWGLPTRPAKPKDTRAKGWDRPCVEVDAIPANQLRDLCEGVITRHVDTAELAAVRQAEELERNTLRVVAGQYGELES